MSGFGMEEDIRRSLQAGFSAHLVKPVDLRQLRVTLEQVLTSSTVPSQDLSSGQAP